MEWIETASGNRISKQAKITGSEAILIAGYTTISPDAELIGDVKLNEGKSSLQIGRYCFIDTGVKIVPPLVSSSKAIHRLGKIGSYSMIGANSKIQSSNLANRVIIGENCVIGNNATIHECVIIKPDTTIPERFNVPPFSLVFMNHQTNKLTVKELPESYKKLIEVSSKMSYASNQFTPSEIP